MESRREEDEAVWVFNTAVCNASVEVLRCKKYVFFLYTLVLGNN